MHLPTIAIINFSSVCDQEVQNAIRSINRQVAEDFMPIWGTGRSLKLYASEFDPTDAKNLDNNPVPADSVIYLINEATLSGALGYHDMNAHEVPIGFVFTDSGDWTVTLSHEALELIVDPTVNIFVPGSDPRSPSDNSKWLWHSYETCDAVERTSYYIDDVRVSNFVTPNYFRMGDGQGTRNDFLGVGVKSFGVIKDSHLGVIDPVTGDWETIYGRSAPSSTVLAKRALAYDHEKPSRPSDDKLHKVLCAYNESPAKGCRGLTDLTGISRTSRYQSRSHWFKSMIDAR